MTASTWILILSGFTLNGVPHPELDGPVGAYSTEKACTDAALDAGMARVSHLIKKGDRVQFDADCKERR